MKAGAFGFKSLLGVLIVENWFADIGSDGLSVGKLQSENYHSRVSDRRGGTLPRKMCFQTYRDKDLSNLSPRLKVITHPK